MPGSIRVTVLDAFDLETASAEDGVAVRASIGKKQYTTSTAVPDQGKVGPWDAEYSYTVLSLTDNLSIALLNASGEVLGVTQVTTPSIVEKGFRDEVLRLEDKQGNAVGQVHVKLSFVLSDEERRKIELMRAKSLAKKAGTSGTAPLESNSSLNGRRSSSASRFSFDKAIEHGGSNGASETEAAVEAVSQEVAAQVAQASTAASQATAEVAQQAAQAAREAPAADLAGRASKTAQKAAEVSKKAAGVAATAATQAGAPVQTGRRQQGRWDEDEDEAEEGRRGVDKPALERQPSVKDRVAAMESPDSSSRKPVEVAREEGKAASEVYSQKKGDERRAAAAKSAAEKELARAGSGGRARGAADERSSEQEEARLAEEDWQRAEAVQAALAVEEEHKRAEAAHLTGKAAGQARRYEEEYRQQRQQEEEHKRRKADKKQEQERRRVAAATHTEVEQRQAERMGEEEEEEHEEEGGDHRTTWQQVASTLAFGVALFFLWPRNTRTTFASRRRPRVSGGQYVVRKGDTLENIVGRMCYVKDSDFYKLNPDVCDRNTIFPGQVIHVPESLENAYI